MCHWRSYNSYLSVIFNVIIFRGDHTHEPVPFLISTAFAAQNINHLNGEKDDQVEFTSEGDFITHALRDEVNTFDELSCVYGSLGRFQLRETMQIIKGMKSKITEIVDYFYNM